MSVDVSGTVGAAYGSVFRHSRVFLIVALPILALATLQTVLQLNSAEHSVGATLLATFVATPISIYLQLALALVWHRTILVPHDRVGPLFRPSRRLWQFFKYGTLYILVLAIPGTMFALRLMQDGMIDARHALIGHEWLFVESSVISLLLNALVVARFGFVFPAASIDRPTGLRMAWRETSGLTQRLAETVLLAQLPFTVAGSGLQYVSQRIDEGTASTLLAALGLLIGHVGFLVVIAAVSLLYAWRHDLMTN